MSDVAAPAVHVDKWKHWSFGEGNHRARIKLPENCAIDWDGDSLRMQDMATERVYDLPKLPPDEAAWFAENWQTVQRAKFGRREQANPRSGLAPTGPFFVANCSMAGGPTTVTYFASFFGVGALQQTFNGFLEIWPGLQSPNNPPGVAGGDFLLQPVLEFAPSPTPTWSLFNTWYAGPYFQGTVPQPAITGGSCVASPGVGYWGAIWHSNVRWYTGCFRGNARNAAPNFQSPLMTTLVFIDRTLRTFGMMNQPYVAVENGGGMTDCSNFSVQAVFGGLQLKEATQFIHPVLWQQGSNSSTCTVAFTCPNLTRNPQAQVTLKVYPF